jgi:hypothetical protein
MRFQPVVTVVLGNLPCHQGVCVNVGLLRYAFTSFVADGNWWLEVTIPTIVHKERAMTGHQVDFMITVQGASMDRLCYMLRGGKGLSVSVVEAPPRCERYRHGGEYCRKYGLYLFWILYYALLD